MGEREREKRERDKWRSDVERERAQK